MFRATSDPTVEPPEIRPRGSTIANPRSSHRGAALEGPTTGGRPRRSDHREVAIGSRATGEPLSTVQPTGSRCRWSGHQGAAPDGPKTGVTLSKIYALDSHWELGMTAHLPGSRSRRRSHSRQSSHRGTVLDGLTTAQPLSTV